MKRILERNLTESFSSPWIPLRQFLSVSFHLRTEPGSNAEGEVEFIGSNDSTIVDGLWADPQYSAARDDETDVTSVFGPSDLNDIPRLHTKLTASTADLPEFVRVVYEHDSGTRGRLSVDFSFVARGVDDLIGVDDATPSVGAGVELSPTDITQFVPGGILTDANIDDAIDAAIEWAQDNTPVGLSSRGYAVEIPAGTWQLSRAHVLPGFGDYRAAVSLRGAGSESTVLRPPASGTGVMFTFGTPNTPSIADVPFTMFLRVSGITFAPATTDTSRWSAIEAYGVVQPIFSDLKVRGLTSSANTDTDGCALNILPAVYDGVEVNSQFVTVRDCNFTECTVGLRVRLAYPVTIENTSCEANHFQNAIIEGALGSWTGNSGTQFMGSPTLHADRWYGQRAMPGTVTGYSRTSGLDSGSGASCGVASSNLCLVTGLSGLDRVLDRGRWLRLTPAGATANELKVRGVYKIDSVASATSCYIRKGSNHTSQGTLTWQVCEAQAGTDFLFEGMYDEGSDHSMFGAWRDSQASGCFTFRNIKAVSLDFVVEADGVQKVRVEDPVRSSGPEMFAWLRQVGQSYVDAPMSQLRVDAYSYPGLVCQAEDLALPGRTVTGMRDAGGVAATRIRTICERLGAVEMFDPRVASSVSLSGADVLSVTGLINGTVLSPSYATREAQWVTNDAEFDAPVIANVAGPVNVNGAGMRGAISAANLPAVPYTCTVVLVGRLESATPLAAEARRVEVRTTDLQQKLALADGTWVNDNLVLTEGTVTGNVLTVIDPDVDTAAHCWIWGQHPNAANVVSTDDGEDYREHNPAFVEWATHTVGENLGIRLADGTDAPSVYPFRWAFFAVFARVLSHAETRQIMDAARNEWPLTP